MPKTTRQHDREPVDIQVVLYWEDAAGEVHSIRPRACDLSPSGICLLSEVELEPGILVCLDVRRYGVPVEGVVRYSVRDGSAYRIGVEFSGHKQTMADPFAKDVDYYEVLQLSPRADMETIHRVYRIMAARFHPDNPESGDQERFLQLSEAYGILSDPARRAQYDAMRGTEPQRPLPVFQAKAFVDDREGEANRRLGVLCLLYAKRRRDCEHPSLGLLELEEMMSIPREYLEFTLWYLKQKRYVETSEGADFHLTATGVDYVEANAPAKPLLHKLLARGSAQPSGAQPAEGADADDLKAVSLQ
ncbi:MAG TPA: DnaJ domain-containing protein [Candidatus Acidoferrales bacterium]|nr:DnaJ domain-containing protein [Candidatus Acidoferrales bacterium]